MSEIKRDTPPFSVIGIIIVAAITLTVSHDNQLFAWLNGKIQFRTNIPELSLYEVYCFVVLFIIPSIYIKLTGGKLRDYGLCLGKPKFVIQGFILLFIGLTIVGCYASSLQTMQDFYGVHRYSSFRQVAFTFFSVLVFMWGWEFMFRGFLMQGLRKHVGKLAIFVQAIPFMILHLDKPPLELYGSLIFGLGFGYYAYVCESFIYGAILHAYFAIL